MSNKIRQSFRFVISTFCALLLMGALPATATAEVSQVTLAKQDSLAFLPFIVMKHDHLLEHAFKKHGLNTKIRWQTFAGGSAAISAVLAGQLNFAATGLTPLTVFWSRSDGAVRGVAGMSAQPEYLNTRNPDVHSISDFTNKDRIAVPAIKVSTQAGFLEMEAAKKFGDKNYDKIDHLTVSLAQPDATTALLNGNISTAFVSQPYTYILLQHHDIHTVFNSFDVLGGPATLTEVWAKKTFHDNNPKTYAAFLEAYKKAMNICNHEHKRVAKIWLDQVNNNTLSVNDVVKILDNPKVSFSETPQNTMKTVNFLYKVGRIKNKPSSWKDMWFSNVHDLNGS